MRRDAPRAMMTTLNELLMCDWAPMSDVVVMSAKTQTIGSRVGKLSRQVKRRQLPALDLWTYFIAHNLI